MRDQSKSGVSRQVILAERVGELKIAHRHG
jgi:hypothetical protein